MQLKQPPPGLPLSSQGEGKCIHVVAGVIRDARGHVLLAQRTQARDLAGLWEFPGGKVESGEAPASALARELHEELGIEAVPGAPVIRVPQRYPDKRLVLDVHEVAQRGMPRGLEGQALAWVAPADLPGYPMPPADRPVVAALLQPAQYLVTPAPIDAASWLADVEAALAGGVRRVQLRAPGLDSAIWARLVDAAAERCRAAGADVLVNGDAALATHLRVGLHLRAAQLHEAGIAAAIARVRMQGGRVAASCHDADELDAAQSLGCDFAVLGPVQATASHPGAEGIGWARFAALREGVSLPIYAIGGLGPGDLEQARWHGGQGIAAIRALWPLA